MNGSAFQNKFLATIVTSISLCAVGLTQAPSAMASPAEVKKTETKTTESNATVSKKSEKTTSTSKTETKAGLPQVLDFGAKWCVPCKKFAPTFDKIAETYKGKATFRHLDVDDAKDKPLVDKYKVSAMPTILVLDKAGKVSWKKEGLTTEAELVKATEAVLK